MTVHELLDWTYGPNGADTLRVLLESGAEPNERSGGLSEAPIHVAARRRRLDAVVVLLDHDADIDARTAGGKTAYAHAIRRGFCEIADVLRARGADTSLNDADELAVAIVGGRLDDARAMLRANPGIARTANPEEDRLLADVAGRWEPAPVALLVDAGANLTATALDSGTPLHQAAWFGRPDNARILIEAGAPLEVFDATHRSSPLGWAVHGSRYSGRADECQDAYVTLVRIFLAAGSELHYPGEPDSDAYFKRLLEDATPRVREVLEQERAR